MSLEGSQTGNSSGCFQDLHVSEVKAHVNVFTVTSFRTYQEKHKAIFSFLSSVHRETDGSFTMYVNT